MAFSQRVVNCIPGRAASLGALRAVAQSGGGDAAGGEDGSAGSSGRALPFRVAKTGAARRAAVASDRWRPVQGADGQGRKPTTVERWSPSGAGGEARFVDEDLVTEILERLKGVEWSEEGVAAALQGWEKPLSSRTLVALLKALQGWELSQAFFNWAKRQSFCEISVYTYNILLRNLRQSQQLQLSERLIEEMLANGVRPDNFTYSTIISCARVSGDLDRAISWYQKMHEADCVPDEITHSTMIDVFGRQGRLSEAIAIYEGLKSTGWKPDRVTYGVVVGTLARAGRGFEALTVYEEMASQGIEPSIRLQNYMVRVMVKIGRLAQAKEAFEKLLECGYPPSEMTLSSLIDAYGKAQEYGEAFKLYDRARAEGWPIDMVVYQCLIKHCADGHFVAEGTKVYTDMRAVFQPTSWTYKTMVNLYAKTNRMQEAMDVFDQLVETGNQPDIVSYTLLIQGYGNIGDHQRMEQVFLQALGKGLEFDERFVGSVLSVLGASQTDEQRTTLLRILVKSDSTMHGIVQKLIADEVGSEELQEAIQALTSRYSQAAQQRYINSLTDLCRRMKFDDRGRQLISSAISSGVYPGVQVRFFSLWSLKLAALSVGAAQYTLEWWIGTLQTAFSDGTHLPSKFKIELLAAKMEKTAQLEGTTLHAEKLELIRSVLKEYKAPFEEGSGDGIWFETTLDDVRPWLWFREPASEVGMEIEIAATPAVSDKASTESVVVMTDSVERVPAELN